LEKVIIMFTNFYKHDGIELPGITKTGFLGGLLLIGKGNLGWAAKLIIN